MPVSLLSAIRINFSSFLYCVFVSFIPLLCYFLIFSQFVFVLCERYLVDGQIYWNNFRLTNLIKWIEVFLRTILYYRGKCKINNKTATYGDYLKIELDDIKKVANKPRYIDYFNKILQVCFAFLLPFLLFVSKTKNLSKKIVYVIADTLNLCVYPIFVCFLFFFWPLFVILSLAIILFLHMLFGIFISAKYSLIRSRKRKKFRWFDETCGKFNFI